jgi:hypothetical protein
MTDTSAAMREVICVLDPDEAAARDARVIAAIVRPGFRLFGAATDGDGPHELIGQLRQPAAPAVPVPRPLLVAAEQ